jgi:stage II sporulation protein M
VLITAGFLGLFTFGVLTVFVVILPFGILGYILGNIASANISALPFIVAILPHGVVEIPAIIIAGAAALRAGSVVTKPDPTMTVGEAWLRAFSDGLKIGIAVVLPLLIVAAVLEVQVTPHIVDWALELGF